MPSITSSNGTPTDDVGTAGDFNIDYGGKFLWGPKGSTSWVGTASSIVGPTGAQGATGASGSGVLQQTTGYGPMAAVSNQGVNATPIEIGIAGTAVPSYFIPTAPTSFMGATFVNTGSSTTTVTFQLWDKTTSTAVYSIAVSAATITSNSFGAGTYPMVAGDTYVWRITGSGSAYVSVAPLYRFTANYSTNLSLAGAGAFAPAALSTTKTTNIITPGVAVTYYYRNSQPSTFYSAIFTIVASGAFSAQFSLLAGSGNAAGTSVVYTSPTITTAGPTQVSGLNIALATNTVYTWSVTGSGSIQAVLTFNVQQ